MIWSRPRLLAPVSGGAGPLVGKPAMLRGELTGTLARGDRVRRLVLLVSVAAMVPVLGGTALAARLACNGGRCVGGDGPDSMYGSGGRDEIYSL